MLKYMELVKEKREQQQVCNFILNISYNFNSCTFVFQKPEESDSQFPTKGRDKDSLDEKDFGVPSLSQATDRLVPSGCILHWYHTLSIQCSFGGFSDNENEGDPFEDW